MNTLREICLGIGVLILMIWAQTDDYRHECLERPDFCSEQNDDE